MRRAVRRLTLVLVLALWPARARAQADFFATDSVLALTIHTDLRALRRDRDTSDSPWRPARLTWSGSGDGQTVPLRLRTRGAFRLRHCDLPPLRLRFSEDSVRGTPFEALRRPKLASYCMNRTDYEQLVLHEYALYKVLALFTPLSYRARLVRVTYRQDPGSHEPVTRYGFLTEDPERFAARVNGTPLTGLGVRQSQVKRESAALLAVWQYFIGNTDWSVPGLHNVELLRVDSLIQAVAFDFDWSGAINAPYARPDSRLPIRSVRERLYRGLCLTAEDLEPVLARFEALKDSIGAAYRAVPDLDPRTVERTLDWYEEFYRDIRDRRRFVQRVVEPTCARI